MASAFNTQSRAEFDANWDRQVGCPAQYEPAVSDAGVVGDARVRSGRRHVGPGRAPRAADDHLGLEPRPSSPRRMTPTLMVAGIHDKQVTPERVRELYADLGAPQKVLIDLGCASHNAMWEKNHTLLFRASLEWLEKGTVNGAKDGMLRLGY